MEGFVDAANAVHLIVVGAVDGTALAASLLAHLAEEGCGLLVVRAEACYKSRYASSVVTVGGKLKGFFKKSEKLSCERSKSGLTGLGC